MTALQVPLAREGHLIHRVGEWAITDVAGCTCGSIWSRWVHDPDQPPWDEWMRVHELRPVCPGSNEIVHECRTDGSGVMYCPTCDRPVCTTAIEFDPHHRTIDAHPARHPVAHDAGAVL